MKTILDLGNGMRWVQLETQDEADREMHLSQTSVGRFFQRDHSMAAMMKSTPPSYYSLRMGEGGVEQALVTARILENASASPFAEVMDRDFVFVGQRNVDPFPEHGDAIVRLGKALNIEIGEDAYPYGRRAEPRM